MTIPKFHSLIDDHRVTIDMALQFESIEDEFWEEAEEEMLVNFLEEMNKEDKPLFPIEKTHELRMRLKEILCYVKGLKYENFTHGLFIKAVGKVALNHFEDRLVFESNSFGDYGNPELQMALCVTKRALTNLNFAFFKNVFDYSDELISVDNNHKELETKFKCWWAAILWTQTNNGLHVHQEALKKSKNIRSINEMNNIKPILLNMFFSKNKEVMISVSGKESVPYQITSFEKLKSKHQDGKICVDLNHYLASVTLSNENDEIHIDVNGLNSCEFRGEDLIYIESSETTISLKL